MYPTVPPLRPALIPPAFETSTQRCEVWVQKLAAEPMSADDLVRISLTLSARWAHGRFAADAATAEIVRLGKVVDGIKAQKHESDQRISELMAALAAQDEELRAYRAALGSEQKGAMYVGL
jgi:hypothetical protein